MQEETQEIPDERLRLLFTCCHPSLSPAAQLALTLRTVAGLTVPEIAAGLLATKDAIQQRIVRAKQKIKGANIPYMVPEGNAINERTQSVLEVIYMMFNEGWRSNVRSFDNRIDLAREAIRVAEILANLLPRAAEAYGLLALMCFHESRPRVQDDSYVPLDEQDRSLWNTDAITQVQRYLKQAVLLHAPGPYQIQATISAAYAESTGASSIDYKTIAALYRILEDMTPSPVVTLNRAVVLARVAGAQTGLDMLVPLTESLAGYQPFYAARAWMRNQTGEKLQAANDYEIAIELSNDVFEKSYLEARMKELSAT